MIVPFVAFAFTTFAFAACAFVALVGDIDTGHVDSVRLLIDYAKNTLRYQLIHIQENNHSIRH